jgi:hypothetical protein
MATRSELSTFARLKSKKSEVQWPLFELRGHPHYEKGQPGECKCFFAMARPYPSRNTAMSVSELGGNFVSDLFILTGWTHFWN